MQNIDRLLNKYQGNSFSNATGVVARPLSVTMSEDNASSLGSNSMANQSIFVYCFVDAL